MQEKQFEQLILDIRSPHPEVLRRRGTTPCGDCGRRMSERMVKESMWGLCKACEDDRLRDVVVG
jgi:hypothetical protein